MISHQRRCIFVHIPKTGGSSIEDAIWGKDRSNRTTDMLWMGGNDPRYRPYTRGFGALQHLRAEQIRDIISNDVFETYFRFAFVRNPWDRAVSQFLHLRRHAPLRRLYGLPEDVSFSDYLERLADGARDLHCQSYEQWRFLYDSAGERLVPALGRFEHLARDFGAICRRLGLTAELAHIERSYEREPMSHYYDDELVEAVSQIYGEDITRFGYEYPQ